MQKIKTQKGITLIALIITIIVMLILVAVTLVITLGENGIIAKASEAKNTQALRQEAEKTELGANAGDKINALVEDGTPWNLNTSGEISSSNLKYNTWYGSSWKIYYGGMTQLKNDIIEAMGENSEIYIESISFDSENVNGLSIYDYTNQSEIFDGFHSYIFSRMEASFGFRRRGDHHDCVGFEQNNSSMDGNKMIVEEFYENEDGDLIGEKHVLAEFGENCMYYNGY